MSIPFRRSILALACAQVLLMSGCGGDSASHADAAQYLQGNDNPRAGSSALGVDTGPNGAYSSVDGFVVSAGDNQQADQGVTVVFTGQVSLPEGHALASLQWSQISGPSARLEGTDTATLTFQAPHVETIETLSFRLTAVDTEGNKASDTVTVVVSALKPFARLSGTSVSEGAGVASLQVTLSEVPHSPVSLGFVVQPVSAQLNSDYSVASGQVAFAAGQQSAVINIPLVNDQVEEPTERFLVKLLANEAVGVAIDSAFVTILDDDSATPVAARALLGPVAGASVTVSDLNNQQIFCSTSTDASNDLAQAGKFSLPANCIKTGGPKLITITGGRDLDTDDNQQLDAEPTNVAGTFHAVVIPENTDFSKTLNISAVTEAAYLRSTLADLTDDSAIAANFNQSASALLKQDLNGDGQINAADLLYWNPSADRLKFKKSLSLLDQTKNAILYGVESSSELTQLANHLLSDPIGLIYADDQAEFSSAYKTVVSAVDNNRLFYATEHYFQVGQRTSVHIVNLTDPAAISQSDMFGAPINRPLDAIEAMAGNAVFRTGVGDVYGESLDIFPVTTTGTSSVAQFDGMARGTISPVDYAQNGLVIGVPFNYNGDTSGRFLRIGQVAEGTFNDNAANPGSNLTFRQDNECPATSNGGSLIRAESALYKVKVLDDKTVAAFYHSDCFYDNESVAAYENRASVYSIAANNIFNLRQQVVLNRDAASGIPGHQGCEVKDAVLNGSALYVIGSCTGLRQVNIDTGQIKTINPSVSLSEPYSLQQSPVELSLSGSSLFELVSETKYEGEVYSSRAIVVKFDVSDANAVTKVGSLGIEGAGACAILSGSTSSISGRTMSASGGNLVLSFAQQAALPGTASYDYLGTLLFDANDIWGEKNYSSERSFTNNCD
ncbi:MAG TPA: Calx-beta domain-containing protein [Pseudomonadales bacterium]|nr:Calx-beta domain-containing protein [Pseudomonadales bacterium]